MRQRPAEYRAKIERALAETLDGNLMWHRFDYYEKSKAHQNLRGEYGNLTDQIAAANIGIDRVGANKDKRFLSQRNISKIVSFQHEIYHLKAAQKKLKVEIRNVKRGLKSYAARPVKNVRKFCAAFEDQIIVVYEDGRRNRVLSTGYWITPKYSWERKHRTTPIEITDDECPHLITLMVMMRSGKYLVPDESTHPMRDDWELLG